MWTLARFALSSCGAAALLADCGGAQPPIASPGAIPQSPAIVARVVQPSATSTYKVTGPLIFAANYGLNLVPVTIYNAKRKDPKPLATIIQNINNARGACVDADGTLYVTNAPNTGDTGWVSEYALGQTKTLRVITEGINYPGYCAIDASGNLWVANIGGIDVTEYLKGSTALHTTITNGLTYPIGIAIDHKGNLYVSNFRPYSAQNIQVYPPGSTAPSRTITDGVSTPVGLAVDEHDTLYATTQNLPSQIEEYRFGKSKPFRVITADLSYPQGLAIGNNGWLYVANAGQYSDEQAILEFSPDSVTPSSRKITKGLFGPLGVAYYPPLLPYLRRRVELGRSGPQAD